MIDTHSQLTIRRLGARDAAALAKLAELDSGVVPSAPQLGLEVEGRLLAAVSLADGSSIADPFSRTAELRALVELRASQLGDREHSGRRRVRAAARPVVATPPRGRVLSLDPRAY